MLAQYDVALPTAGDRGLCGGASKVHATANTSTGTSDLEPARPKRGETKASSACLGHQAYLPSSAQGRVAAGHLVAAWRCVQSALVVCVFPSWLHATADPKAATLVLEPARTRRGKTKRSRVCLGGGVNFSQLGASAPYRRYSQCGEALCAARACGSMLVGAEQYTRRWTRRPPRWKSSQHGRGEVKPSHRTLF